MGADGFIEHPAQRQPYRPGHHLLRRGCGTERVEQCTRCPGFSPDKNDPYDYDIQPGVDSSFDMDSDLLSMTIDYDIGWGEITSITAWNDYDYSVDQDPDRSQLDVLTVRNDDFSGDSFSQELRFSSQAGDNIDYMLGLFYYEQTTKRGGSNPFVFIGDDFINLANQQNLPPPFPPNPGCRLIRPAG